MPIYEYEPCSGECRICKTGFTLHRQLSAPPLVNCPLCRKPVKKVISAVSSPKVSKPMSLSAAKNAGFKVFKKVGSGEYERQ